MAYINYKSKDCVSIETKGQGCTSPIQSADQNNDYNVIDNSDETLVKTVIPSVQQTIANQVPNQQAENVINDSTSNLQTNGKDYYYSTIKEVNNTIGTARTPPVQPAIPNRVQNQQTENVISDSELKSRLNTINDNINLLKNKYYRLKIGFIIVLFVICVTIGATSSAMGVIFKQNLEDSLKSITETEPGPSDVSFTSYLTTSLTNVSIGTTVVFDGTRHNAGNAYNASTGVFTCPTAGTFLFSMTVSSFNNKTTALRMKVDGISKTFTFAHNTLDLLLTSNTAILVYHLNTGQRVWVETYNKDNTDIYRGYTSFVGVLIHR